MVVAITLVGPGSGAALPWWVLVCQPPRPDGGFVWNSRHPAEVGKLKALGFGIRAIARELRMPPSSVHKAIQLAA